MRDRSGTWRCVVVSLLEVFRRFAVTIRWLRFFLRFVSWFVAFGVGFFWIIGVYAGLDGYDWGIGEWGV